MSTNHTPNYSLSQWERTDKVLMDDFNADNEKIDAALAGKADKSALNTLSQTVSGHSATLSKKGNCQIWTTSYTGTGTYGSEHPTTLTFPKVPAIAFVISASSFSAMFAPGQTAGFSLAGGGMILSVSWNGSTLSWFQHQNANGQMNNLGETYQVIALFPA